MRFFSVTLSLGFAAVLGGAAHQTWPDWWWHLREPSPQLVFERRIAPFLNNTCYECHDSGSRKGDFVLDRLSLPVPASSDREAWERVLQHVTHNLMPPPDAEQPAPAERVAFLTALERILHPVDPRNPDPGRVVLRRLNREEYKNTVQDIFGVAFNPSADFPDDDSGYGFDHIASVLTVSPLLFERYLAAAEQIAAAVVPDPVPPPRIFPAPPERWTGADDSGPHAALFSNKTLTWKFTPPAAGRYRLRLEVSQDQAGDEPARFAIRLDGDTLRELPADGFRRRPRVHTVEVDLPAAPVELGVAFLNDYYRAATDGGKAQDRNFFLHHAALEGPYFPPGVSRPEVSLPDWIDAQRPDESRAAWFTRNLSPIVHRAYRRPPSPAELERVAALALEAETAGDSPAAAYQVALQAILASPAFLFLGDFSVSESVSKGKRQNRPLSDHALAARLSYFLWSGPPDETLLALAGRGELRSNLKTETNRLLDDPKAERFVQNFAGQWLEIRNLQLRTPDPGLYPEWSPELAASMKEETLRFFTDFLVNERPITELLTADHTFVDERLARFYGLPPPPGDGFHRVATRADRRAGLLGQAGVLTVTSYPNRTSPVLRGKFVLEKILGTPPPPPPPNIPSLAEHPGGGQPATLRDRLELHRSSPSCMGCHALIDPIGFALENYDALGRRRDMEEGRPIDSSGHLVTGEPVNSAVTLSAVLASARHDEFTRNFARTLLTYALGRGLDYYDRPTIDRIVATAAARGHTLPAYLDAVVASIAFQNERIDHSAKPPAVSPALARHP